MGKNKKKVKKAQMFSNFLAFKAGQGNVPNPNIVIVNKPLLPDLLKMYSPGSFQTPHGEQDKLTELIDDNSPNLAADQATQIKPSGSNTLPQVNKWTALKPVEDPSIKPDSQVKDKGRPNLTVIKGNGNKIHLVIDKSKKPTVQLRSSPQPYSQSSDTQNQVATAGDSPTPEEDTRSHTPPLPIKLEAPVLPTGQRIQTTSSAQQSTQYSNKLTSNKGAPRPSRSLSTCGDDNSLSPQVKTETVKTGPKWAPNPRKNTQVNNNQQHQPNTETVKTGPNWAPNPRNNAQVHATPQYQPNTGTGWPRHMHMIMPSVLSPWPTAAAPVDPLTVQIESGGSDRPQAYSPSDVYTDVMQNDARVRKRSTSIQAYMEATDDELDSELVQAGSKRLSAFQRLGPVAEQPKKPKLTINLLCQKDVREVVDETDDIPTHLRDYIKSSTDETVAKYREVWPFKDNVVPIRTVSFRHSKSVMMLETEQMEDTYIKDSRFIMVSVTGYPHFWKKEDVLEAVLKSVNGKSFIPCFVEFSRTQCKFLVIRSRQALLDIHKYGFKIRIEDFELIISLSAIHLYLNHLDFVPRLILRKLLVGRMDADNLDLSEFTTKIDISHFIYFPLSRLTNQSELIQLQSTVPWDCLTSINLSHNNITTITGLDLYQSTPRLRHLDLSYNRIEKVTALLQCRYLPLKSLHLEGNPLCHDYIEQEHYVKALTMLFSGLESIDGMPIRRCELPVSKRNYCPEDALGIVSRLLEVMFPLLDASQEQRYLLQDLYHEDAVLTVTYYFKLRYGPVFKDFRNLFNRARVLDEGEMESIKGATSIAKVVNRWPDMMHDPATFNVDVLFHSDSTTIVKIAGILKITAESLADDEHVLSFTRTIVLHSKDGVEYKITNEMLFWDLPDKAYAETAFKITRVKPKNVNVKLDAPPDDELKENLLKIFMQITEMEKKPSERCLESQEWNIRNALEYFSKLLKLDNLSSIMKDH